MAMEQFKSNLISTRSQQVEYLRVLLVVHIMSMQVPIRILPVMTEHVHNVYECCTKYPQHMCNVWECFWECYEVHAMSEKKPFAN